MLRIGQRVTLQRDCGDHKQGETGEVVGVNEHFEDDPTYNIKWMHQPDGRPDREYQEHWFVPG